VSGGVKKRLRDKMNVKVLGKGIFAKYFGFEQGVDITDDVAVLFRRNVVIKNIVFVSNLMYSVILFLLSLSTRDQVSDWIVTFIAFPLTYVINKFLKKLINMDPHDKTKQSVAMYVSAFYIFFSSILIYARLYQREYFETAAYILMYYAIVVISLYQERKLLSSSFQGLLALLTVIHFIWTYNIQKLVNGESIVQFLPRFVTLPEFSDILLRTLLFILFYFVVYAIVSMGQYMQEERKKELIKRRQVQGDFSHIVGDLFSVVFSSSYSLMEKRHASQVQQMSEKLADYYGMSYEKIKVLNEYALIHLKYNEIKNMLSDMNTFSEQSYDVLKEKTELGSKIAKRMQLAQKCEDIARAHIEDTANDNFLKEMLLIQPEIESQIILLSDLYITMRGPKPYKRPMAHSIVFKAFQSDLVYYFDHDLKERFLKFHDEFAEMYNNF
jgi:HD-GYP domain-containing protein (c-di-GMP phosphodiesterase class II)